MKAPDFWRHNSSGLAGVILAPLGQLYGLGSRLRRVGHRGWKCPVPVICVGNLVAGGAGKTPVVLDLVSRMAKSPAHVLSRGYGGSERGPLRVNVDTHTASQVGDEALLGAAITPTWVSRDRQAGCRAACADGAAAIILDDGFQDPSVQKDLSLVVVDGGYGFGNGRMIPAGPLRETIECGLGRADAVVMVGEDTVDVSRHIGEHVTVLRARLVPVETRDWQHEKVVAFAGIGRPEKFFQSLRDLGCEMCETLSFADHHSYSADELDDLKARALACGATLVTTTKDMVRIPEKHRLGIDVLAVRLEWEDPSQIKALIKVYISGSRHASSAGVPAHVTSNLPTVSPGKWLVYGIQAVSAYLMFLSIRLLPLAVASGFGGWLGRSVGPHLPHSKRARRNLQQAFADKSPAEIETIIRAMWDNFGRVVFEFPLLHRLRFGAPGDGDIDVEVHGWQHTEVLRDDGKPGIFLSGHFANWELAGRSVMLRGLPLHLIYRLPNNPLTVRLLMHRNPGQGEMIPKGARGARRALKLLKNGEHLGIMADQKMNDGIAIPFFGRDAMTAPALAQFALRFNCPVVPVRVERMGGVRFKVTHYPPLIVENTGDRQADIRAFMIQTNQMLENWVRERPEQWLWLHNRWPG